MFCSPQDVQKYTGYEVTGEVIFQAQAVIEAYVGRLETDVSNAQDLETLRKATSYQAAYMRDDYTKVFQQASVAQVVQNGSLISFRSGEQEAPWIAPLAKLSCKHLSWRKSRSVKTGGMWSRDASEPNTRFEAF
jgi:hypothetical protein